jgi:hypothetical protein
MKVTKIILAITVGITIAGCDNPAFDSPIKKAVRAKLKDPDSAKFKDEVVVQTRACISVNAKNSYGGFTGATIAHLKNLGLDNWYVETFDGEPCYAHVLERKLEIDKGDEEKAKANEEKAEKQRKCRESTIARKCQDNAVKEDYSICMKREGITDC